MRCVVLMLVIGPLFATACDTGVPFARPINLDGQWRGVLQAGFGLVCFTVSDNQVIQVDDGCLGQSNAIISREPATITGDRVLWVFGIDLNGQSATVTLDVTVQPDGSLTGSMAVFTGGILLEPTPIVLNRR